MRIFEMIFKKLHAIVVGIREKIGDAVEGHRDIGPEKLAEQLDKLADNNPQKLHWRTSIVDLLKLLDMDSSLKARKEMADDFGWDDPANHNEGAYSGTAEQNTWLHEQVLREVGNRGIPLRAAP